MKADEAASLGVRERTAPFSMQHGDKLRLLWDLAQSIPRSSYEAVVQCGVWKGGSLALLASAAPLNAKVWGFDSFQGCACPTENDRADDGPGKGAPEALMGEPGNLKRSGYCMAKQEDAEMALRKAKVDRSKVHIVTGWVEETLAFCDIGPIALLHVDVDWYGATQSVLRHLWPLTIAGGWVVLDDYGYWAGCRKAVDEFFGGDPREIGVGTDFRTARSALAFRKAG